MLILINLGEPERVSTFEFGYKSIILDRKLCLDADLYHNWSKNFISPNVNILPQGRRSGLVVTDR